MADMILIVDTMSTGVATTGPLHHECPHCECYRELGTIFGHPLGFLQFPQTTHPTHTHILAVHKVHSVITIMSAQTRRHCKNLFSEDCYSYIDDNFTTLSPPSSSSSSSSVTVSSISTVWNMTLIILSSVTVSIISLYSVIIIHRNDTVHSYYQINQTFLLSDTDKINHSYFYCQMLKFLKLFVDKDNLILLLLYQWLVAAIQL